MATRFASARILSAVGLKASMVRYLLTVLTVALVTWLCLSLTGAIRPSGLGALYLLAVCWLAYLFGRGPAIFASAACATLFNYYFVPPYFVLVGDREYFLTFGSLLGASLAISNLTARAREQAAAALSREQETVALFEFSRALTNARNETEIQSLVADQLSMRLGVDVRYSAAPSSAAGAKSHPVIARDGETMGWLTVAVLPQPLGPAHQRVIDTFTRQAALAIERERLAGQAQEAEVFKAAEQLHTTLLNSISHDLRSPLVAIRGTLQALLDETHSPLSPTDRELLLSNALQETDRLNRFAANLMQMTRLESGHLLLRLEAQDLSEVVESTLQHLRHPQRIKLNLPAELPPVLADFVLLQQALWNVLENALKFAPSGPIHVGAQAHPATVELWVRDFGPGVPGADRELVFHRFYRGRTETPGSGLGLPICRGLLQAMGGSVALEDAQPGARFRLTLNIAEL